MGNNENCNDSNAPGAFNYQRVYICSPFRGDPQKNAELARTYCRVISTLYPHTIPIAPHIYLTQFLDDDDPKQREAGLAMGRAILATCQVVLVFGQIVSEGMRAELKEAARLGIPVYNGAGATYGEIVELSAEYWEKLVGIPKPTPIECPARRLIDPADFERYMLFEYPHTPGNQNADIDDDSLRAILDAAHEYAKARGIATDGKK